MSGIQLNPGDLVVYRTLRRVATPAVFLALVGGKALVRIAGQERTVNLKCLEAL